MHPLTVAHTEFRLPLLQGRIPCIADVERTFHELSVRGLRIRRDAADARLDGAASQVGSASPFFENNPGARVHTAFSPAQDLHLEKSKGRGCWDVFRFSEHLLMTVADVRYDKDAWLDVPGENVLKLRLVLAGRLLAHDKAVLAAGPAGILCVQSNEAGSGYFIEGGIDTKLIILHCKADLLLQTFGLTCAQTPNPFDLLLRPQGRFSAATSVKIRFTPALFRATTDIMNSCETCSDVVRNTYLYAKCLEVIGLILQHLANEKSLSAGRRALRDADVKQILEARNVLAERFAHPPSIKQLARLVGVNRTKLKAGFKTVTGSTISEFVRRSQMEKAAELLLSKSFSIGEVAHQVGYEYPANFTMAFKRYFGYLPKQLKSRHD